MLLSYFAGALSAGSLHMRAPLLQIWLSALALVAALLSVLPAAAETGAAVLIGKVEHVTGSVTISHADAVALQASLGPSGQAKVGDQVYQGDTVQTGADGTIGIAFTDGSAFNLSPNARMVLDEFVYDPKGSKNSAFISLTKGTFTFIAGKVAKTGDLKVDTPVATMGIRGTTPHVEISENGKVAFSTLVEKGLHGAAPVRVIKRKASADSPQIRQVSSLPGQSKQPPPATAATEAAKELDKQFDKRLGICRGC